MKQFAVGTKIIRWQNRIYFYNMIYNLIFIIFLSFFLINVFQSCWHSQSRSLFSQRSWLSHSDIINNNSNSSALLPPLWCSVWHTFMSVVPRREIWKWKWDHMSSAAALLYFPSGQNQPPSNYYSLNSDLGLCDRERFTVLVLIRC